ncbi:MAG: ParA family protein [Deltaproteobacteria bacterium]|jgi:chromosome partitioning protein|nr:ParA family protein [Deltaproteobacteria bacterium]
MSPFSVVAIINQKGGVGKTTTAINMSACLGYLGFKTLLVDADPQSNSTISFGLNPETLTNTFYSFVFGKSSLSDTIIKTQFSGLYILPTNTDLYSADIELENMDNVNYSVIHEKMKQEITDFDFVIFDSPPHIGPLTKNLMRACDTLIVPMKTDFMALQGIAIMINNLKEIQKNINPKINLEGILLTMYNSGTKLCKEVEADVKRVMGNMVFETIITHNITLAEAPSHGQPIIYYNAKSTGSENYKLFTAEFLRRMKISKREFGL